MIVLQNGFDAAAEIVVKLVEEFEVCQVLWEMHSK